MVSRTNQRLKFASIRTRKKRKLKFALTVGTYIAIALIGYCNADLNYGEVPKLEKAGLHLPDPNLSELEDAETESSRSNDFPEDLFTLEQRRNGAIAIHFIFSFYLFYGLFLICDEYFVPAVESICKELKISSDVAGATFMAVSTSAPELFTNFMGTFLTRGDLGLGTIVGSTMLNILVVASVCGIFGVSKTSALSAEAKTRGIPLDCWPLTRDSFFFVSGLGTLLLVLKDQRVYWYEAAGMIALYSVYVLVLWKNDKVKGFVDRCFSCCRRKRHKRISRFNSVNPEAVVPTEVTPLLVTTETNGIVKPAKIDWEPNYDSDQSVTSNEFDETLVSSALIKSTSHWHDESVWEVFKAPKEGGFLTWLEWLLAWPIKFVYAATIPDPKIYIYKKWYPVTMLMCILWTGVLSYLLSWMMTTIGETLSIPESVTGLTFLAVGTSLPEVFSSIIVARQGLGPMAFSSSIGSNTFDILFCLGLPWLIQTFTLIHSWKNYVEIHSIGLEFSTFLMIGSVLLLYFILACNKFVLDRKIGIVSAIMYVIFITVAILVELRVVGSG